jgi:hypothetical protein
MGGSGEGQVVVGRGNGKGRGCNGMLFVQFTIYTKLYNSLKYYHSSIFHMILIISQ